jgi:hypothetical protein
MVDPLGRWWNAATVLLGVPRCSPAWRRPTDRLRHYETRSVSSKCSTCPSPVVDRRHLRRGRELMAFPDTDHPDDGPQAA